MRKPAVLPTRLVPLSAHSSQIGSEPMELPMTVTAAGPLAALSSSLTDIVARAAPALVSVQSHRSRASGFVWKPGLVITADETLADEGEVEVHFADGGER